MKKDIITLAQKCSLTTLINDRGLQMNSIQNNSSEDFTFTGIQSIREKDHFRINKLIYKSVVNNEFVKKSKRLKTQFSVCYALLVFLVPLLFIDNSHDKYVAIIISFLTFLLISW